MSQRAQFKRGPQLPAAHLAPADQPETKPSGARRDFLRMVSHELRTPLNSIIGFSEILACELYGPHGTPQYKEYAEIIHSSGQRLLRLVNQVLELAKLEADGGELELGAEPLEAVFEDAHRAMAGELAARNLELKISLPEPAPSAFADAKALRTAVVNLLQNAAHHAPEGGEVRLIGRVQGPLVQIEIADDGEGMDSAKLERMLGAHENALTRRDGAGFGWVIVQALCRAMGGRFEVATAPGEGLSAVLSFRRAR